MFYRLIYIVWRIFWSSILVLLTTVVLFGSVVFLLLQTDPIKQYLASHAENWFNETYEGELRIGHIGGVLPFHVEITDTKLTYEGDTVAEFESLGISVDLIGLLRNDITINDITLHRPGVFLESDGSDSYTLIEALQKRELIPLEQERPSTEPFQSIDIYAPMVQVYNGTIHIRPSSGKERFARLPDSVTLADFNTELFLEVTENQRYLDITYLTLQIPELDSLDLSLSGQIYNDSHFFELNAMQLQFGRSYLDWNSEFTGINFFDRHISQQFRESSYQITVEDSRLAAEQIQPLAGQYIKELPDLHFTGEAVGQSDALEISNGDIRAGENTILMSAKLDHFTSSDSLAYEVDIAEMTVSRSLMNSNLAVFDDIAAQNLQTLGGSAQFYGTTDTLVSSFDVSLPGGIVSAQGGVGLNAPYSADYQFDANNINWENLYRKAPFPTELFLNGRLAATNLHTPQYEFDFDMELNNSSVNNIPVSEFHLEGSYADATLAHEFIYLQDENFLEGQGWVDLSDSIPALVISGQSSGLDLRRATNNDRVPETEWNIDFDINWHGTSPDQWHGRVIVDILPSVVNGTELDPHQMYLDLDRPDNSERSLRLTSTLFDLLVEGNIDFSSFNHLYSHWESFFQHRVREDLLFEPVESLIKNAVTDQYLDLDILLEIKNTELLSFYFPQSNTFDSDANISLNLFADDQQFQLDAHLRDPRSGWKGLEIENAEMELHTSFHFDQNLREYQDIRIDIKADHFQYRQQTSDSLSWIFQGQNDSLYNQSRAVNIGDDIIFQSEWHATLHDEYILANISEFVLGNESYFWNLEGNPILQYGSDHKLHVDEFNLISGHDQIFVDGTFSNDEQDSVQYRFENVNLERISQIIDGRIPFEGTLNADFVTKTLLNNPFIHGNMDADQLSFDGRPVGDVSLESLFNPERDRFDTQLHILTDSTVYADYLTENNGIGQDISATGWFKPPEPGTSADSLYYFDVDARELDAWVLTFLLDSVFDEIEGRGTGNLFVSGNYEYIYFDGDFEIHETTVAPVFFETEYILNGPVSINREEGIELQHIEGRDLAGGTAVLSGNYDFNDFQAEKFMDLELQMNNLLFLDNSEGPDVPFFGEVAGTGVITITGSNVSPFVRTTEPIYTSSPSRLSIPFMEQSMADDQSRLIRFVKNFDDADLDRELMDDPEILRQIDRSFMEVFRLDLQFVAAPNSTVRLIFDPVTGEVVNARGEGRIRISLEDESLQIFGNFDIDDGDYLFVGGDILTRRFSLRDGGSIRWEGDPANALLDITAVYRSRANIAPLIGGAAMERANRVPVELLLEITGPIENIENDFYFEFPNAIDATQNAAVLNILNSEEQKLIQATSLLFTGSFISGGLVGETQTQELGSTLQARAGQVGLSQLLSTQINALLRDNAVNLDVDLNLFGFDQADLGIALRLFDDRLVLRREGEVGGEQTQIGDLGAMYRINPNLSVEVFHRTDPMLMSILGQPADIQKVDGVGVEAQFRFNSWKEFGERVWHNISTVFGLFDRDDPDSPTEE